jgi:two-component system sensor histidine kinase/response regulator
MTISKADILIVDDLPANLKILMAMLTQAGYKVRSVLSGEMALTAAHTAAPDLILLDVNMPRMNGYEVCETLQADANLKNVPVIFITALGAELDKERAEHVGAVDYILKPFRLDEVLEKIKYHLANT